MDVQTLQQQYSTSCVSELEDELRCHWLELQSPTMTLSRCKLSSIATSDGEWQWADFSENVAFEYQNMISEQTTTIANGSVADYQSLTSVMTASSTPMSPSPPFSLYLQLPLPSSPLYNHNHNHNHDRHPPHNPSLFLASPSSIKCGNKRNMEIESIESYNHHMSPIERFGIREMTLSSQTSSCPFSLELLMPSNDGRDNSSFIKQKDGNNDNTKEEEIEEEQEEGSLLEIKRPIKQRCLPMHSHWGMRREASPTCTTTATTITAKKRMARAMSECTFVHKSTITGSGEVAQLIDCSVGIDHILPCFDSPKDAIKRINPTTMTRVVRGDFDGSYSKLIIVDCRYPYEYHGGHLPGSLNICSLEDIDRKLFAENDLNIAANTVIIFHCEFSSERAPRMALHVRNRDRVLNAENYPALYYPQVYILDGGYKSFYLQFPGQCDPPYQYVPMRTNDHRDELRYHQRLKFNDGQAHGKHRHKLRSCSLRKSHSLAMPHPTLAISDYFKHRQNDYTISNSGTFLKMGEILSSDIGDICDQISGGILEAAESVLLAVDDGCASK